MIYLNPFILLEQKLGEDIALDTKSIQRAKRKLLIEFDLNNDSTINYFNEKISKEHVINLIDEINHFEKGSQHFMVYSDKYLTEFLNTGDTNYFKTFTPKHFHTDYHFLQFIRRYYISTFDKALYKNFADNHFDNIRVLLAHNLFNQTEFEIQCYRSTQKYLAKLSANLKVIKEYIRQNFSPDSKKIEQLEQLILLINTTSINCLNNYFEPHIIEIALTLNDIAYYLHKEKINKVLTNKIINKAVKINIKKEDVKNKIYEQFIEIETGISEKTNNTSAPFDYSQLVDRLKNMVKNTPDIYNSPYLQNLIKKYMPDFFK